MSHSERLTPSAASAAARSAARRADSAASRAASASVTAPACAVYRRARLVLVANGLL